MIFYNKIMLILSLIIFFQLAEGNYLRNNHTKITYKPVPTKKYKNKYNNKYIKNMDELERVIESISY